MAHRMLYVFHGTVVLMLTVCIAASLTNSAFAQPPSESLLKVSVAGAKKGTKKKICKAVYVKRRPGKNKYIIDAVPKGTTVVVIGYKNRFAHIKGKWGKVWIPRAALCGSRYKKFSKGERPSPSLFP